MAPIKMASTKICLNLLFFSYRNKIRLVESLAPKGNKPYEILTMSKAASLASCQRELLLLNAVKSLFSNKFPSIIVRSLKGLNSFTNNLHQNNSVE